MSLTREAQKIIKQHFKHRADFKQIAVDATCGNGNDTLFLVEQGFKRVFAFDVQAVAIERTRQKLSKPHSSELNLINAGHENLSNLTPPRLNCVMFNLGYLPSAAKQITTHRTTTISALDQALKHLHDEGLITIICYPGHPQGKAESREVKQWLSERSSAWQVERIDSVSPTQSTPFLCCIKRQSIAENQTANMG